MEIGNLREQLGVIKQTEALWRLFDYHKDRAGGGHEDRNGLRRYALLIELQYDTSLQERDRGLLRYLLKQEIDAHANHSMQGLEESLQLAAYLLARMRNVEDVSLFLEAKLCNFDTHCGFDIEYLFSAGVEETIRYLDKNDLWRNHAYLSDIRDEIPDMVTAERLDRWFLRMEGCFPPDKERETVTTLFYRALQFGREEEARACFEKLESELEPGAEAYDTLYYMALRLGDGELALLYLKKRRQLLIKPWDQISSRCKAAELYIGLKAFDQALKEIRSCREYLAKEYWWRRTGLGRSMFEALLDIALGSLDSGAMQDRDLAMEAYAWANKLMRETRNTHMNMLKKAVRCAAALQRRQDKRYYSKQLALEAHRHRKLFR